MTPIAFILASDLDGTLLPPSGDSGGRLALSAFSSSFRDHPGIVLAYVTGRHLTLALEGIRESGLPNPDFLACDVGTTLYRRDGDDYRLDHEYRAFVKDALGDVESGFIRKGLQRAFPLLQIQEFEKQGEYKLSYYLEAGTDFHTIVASIGHILERVGAHVNVVFSVDAVTGRGLLDILPAGISKVSAVDRLAVELGIQKDHVVYAGDSGNDTDALLSGFSAIVVGNASADLKEDLMRMGHQRGLMERLYFAKERYAAGVLEGCRKFGLPIES